MAVATVVTRGRELEASLPFCFGAREPSRKGNEEVRKLAIVGSVLLLLMTTMALIVAAAPARAEGGKAVPPPPGLVSWWPLDGDANDIVGTNHGTLHGATFAPGLVDEAVSLDGVDDFIMVPHSPSLNFGTNDFTSTCG